MFESTKIPDDWKDYLEAADLIIVPSKFCQKVFKDAGFDSMVIPLGYDESVYQYIERPEHKVFTFLHYDAFNYRKGFREVFNAFTEEFKDDMSVNLILKTTHYRSPMNFTWESIASADQARMRLTRHYLELKGEPAPLAEAAAFTKEFYTALANDLDTPKAIASLWEFIKDASVAPEVKKKAIEIADKILGLGITEARTAAKLSVIEQKDLPEEVRSLLSEREAARKEKDFAKADELRQQIEAQGFEVKDTAVGAELTKK
jgi:cysteinyl-tRNA synthetase